MARGGPACERTSRAAKALIAGFGFVLMLAIGWLALLVGFLPEANTTTADPNMLSAAASAGTDADPVVAVSSGRIGDPTGVGSSPAPAWGSGIAGIPALPSAPAEAPFIIRAPHGATTAEAAEAQSSALPGRLSVGAASIDSYARADFAETAGVPALAVSPIPLPVPRPRHFASTPMPRPRPHLDEQADAQPQEKSLFDILIDRQR